VRLTRTDPDLDRDRVVERERLRDLARREIFTRFERGPGFCSTPPRISDSCTSSLDISLFNSFMVYGLKSPVTRTLTHL